MILWFRYLRREGGSLRKANDTKPVFCGPEARLRWERRHCAPIYSSACPTQQNNTGFVAFGGLLDFRRPGCLVSSSIGKADFTFFRFVKSSQIFFCACVISVTFAFSAPRFLSLRWGEARTKKNNHQAESLVVIGQIVDTLWAAPVGAIRAPLS